MPNLPTRALDVLQWPFRGRQERLMKDRDSYTRSDFSQFFLARDVPQKIVDEVWDALVEAAVVTEFRPKPEDQLLKTFGLAEEDLDEDVVLPLLKSCGCRIPTSDEVAHLKPLETVADLVEFVSRLRQ